jgi:hypothetical protein
MTMILWCLLSELNSEKIWKIWKKNKLNSEKIWKIWKKSQLNSEIIWKIWKKNKSNSEPYLFFMVSNDSFKPEFSSLHVC